MLRLAIFLTVFLDLVIDLTGQRRISDGTEDKAGRKYVAYIVQNPNARTDTDTKYDDWLCGGAVVNEFFIVTSAACVSDVEYLYAIAGLREYVPGPKTDEHECTKVHRKKVVFTAVPTLYEFPEQPSTWPLIDIAAIKVESAFDLTTDIVNKGCTHVVRAIPINYEVKHQLPGTEVLAFGWGHDKTWRQPYDSKNYNQRMMHYISTRLSDKEECQTYFANYEYFDVFIEKYMLCTLEGSKGRLDADGHVLRETKPIADGCQPVLRNGIYTCEEDEVLTSVSGKRCMDPEKMYSRIMRRQQTRRMGICQNDHGGPLVTFIGGHETLIGVASVFRVTNESTCTGPYLYTSTQCTSSFLACNVNAHILKENYNCDKFLNNSYKISRRSISWEKHPDGPAANERIMVRAIPPFDKKHPWRKR